MIAPAHRADCLTINRDVCKKCGSEKPADWECSHCGGHGLVTGAYGDPTGCSNCGESGIQYPPVCPDCAGFRKAHREVSP